MDNLFFKATKMYREYYILNRIDKETAVTQRQLSDALETAVSLIHSDLTEFEKKGLIQKDHIYQTKVNYTLTKRGLERKRFLDLTYYNSSQKLYDYAKDTLKRFMHSLIQKGFYRLLLYGAGEVSQMMLTCIRENQTALSVVGIIDDDASKQSESHNVSIINLKEALKLPHDGILIASYAYHEQMIKKLLALNYSNDKIIRYFS